MDNTQIAIIIISSVLTVMLVFLGIQLFYILREIRRSIQKVNKMLDDAGKVSGSVSDGLVNMSGFINGLKAGIGAIASLKGKGEDHE